MSKRSERSKIRYSMWQNMKDCEKLRLRVVDVMHLYIESGNDDYAAYVGQLLEPIKLLAGAFERTRENL